MYPFLIFNLLFCVLGQVAIIFHFFFLPFLSICDENHLLAILVKHAKFHLQIVSTLPHRTILSGKNEVKYV